MTHEICGATDRESLRGDTARHRTPFIGLCATAPEAVGSIMRSLLSDSVGVAAHVVSIGAAKATVVEPIF
jgi:hypothetical protein